MRIQHLPVNFEDARGSITDIFVHNPKDTCTVITSKAGAVRGNHYHKLSTQYVYVLSGRLRVLSRPMDGDGEVHSEIAGPGDLVTHLPMEAHTLVAEEDSVFLAFADGLRGGDSYEEDTYRLDAPLSAAR